MAEAPTTLAKAAYRVIPADGRDGILNAPHELYFFLADDWTLPVPADQDSARRDLEKFCSVIRRAIADQPKTLDFFFQRALTTAQATFTPAGFNPGALSGLEESKQEVVHRIGGPVRNAYFKRFGKSVILAIALIMLTAFGLDWLAKRDSSRTNVEPAIAKDTADKSLKAGEQAKDKLPTPATNSPPDTPLKASRIRFDNNFSIMHIGVLLSFSMIGVMFANMLRNMSLSFENLPTAEVDLLPPWVPLVFYGIAILIMGTLFEEQWVTVSIGEKFSTQAINDNAIAAATFGLFLGIAERLVPQQVVRYATEVVMRTNSQQAQANR